MISAPIYPSGNVLRPLRLAVAMLLLPVALAGRAAAPDAGQTLEQFQGPQVPLPRPHPAAPVPAPAAEKGENQGLMMQVRGVRFVGNTRFSQRQLALAVADMVGIDKPKVDLTELVSRVTQFYRRQGYTLARAYLPPQNIKGGVLEVDIVEGRLGQVVLTNGSSLTGQQLQGFINHAISPGEVVTNRAVNRALAEVNLLPGVGQASGSFRRGAATGTSDLLMNVDPAPAYSGNLGVDNYGERFSGQDRLSGHLLGNNPFGLGDRLDAQAVLGENRLAYGHVGWDAPVGYSGLRAGLLLDDSRYALAGGSFNGLDEHGVARSAGLSTTYPLWLAPDSQVLFSGLVQNKQLHDVQGALESDTGKTVDELTLGLSGNLEGARNILAWRLSDSAGSLSIRTPDALQIDGLSAHTDGRFQKLSAGFSDSFAFAVPWSLYWSGSGQVSSHNLDGSEALVLGGENGVRAYPQGEGVGAEGWLTTLEIRRALVPGVQAALFEDIGAVRINHTNYTDGRNGEHLSGSGLGLDARRGHFQLNLSVAWRTGPAPLSDGDDRKPRVWAQLLYGFD